MSDTTLIETPTGTSSVADINAAREAAVAAGKDPYAGAGATKTSAAAGLGPTAADIYAGIPKGDPNETDGLNAAIGSAKTAATTPVDEGSIRSRILSQFQSEIDATNSIYAEKLAEAKQQGVSRLGSARAIAARSGTLGSDFSAAQKDEVNSKNNAIEGSIEQERLAKLDSITNQASSDAAKEIADKRTAQTQGLDAYLKYLGDKTTRKNTGLANVANSLYNAKIDPTTMSKDQLSQIAASYGGTPEELLSVYASTKKTNDATAAKTALETAKSQSDTAKNNERTVAPGAEIYTLDPKTGKYTLVANNPKVPAIPTVKPVNSTDFTDDTSGAITQFRTKMTQNGWKGVNPNDYAVMADYFLKTYGSAGLSKFKSSLSAANLKVDNGE